MLPKKSRLTAAQVKEVLARGRALRAGGYTGKYLEGTAPLRMAVIVPKRLVRTAVARNRLRRAAYAEVPSLPLPKTGSLALFARPVKK